MKDFWATEATLNTVMLAYDQRKSLWDNLMGLLRQVLLITSAVKHSSNSVQHTLQTLRYKLFAKGLHHDRKSKTDSESGLGNATARLDARLVGCVKNLQLAS